MGRAAFGKTEAAERGKLLRPIRIKNPIPRRAKSTYRDKSPEEWIYIDIPAIVSAELFAAASEQLERNRRLSQRNARGKRYLLQGLVVCAKCGYAYYGKTVSRSSAKGKDKWGYYRCIGTDSYRFAGGRICDNKQVRVEQLDGYVWESVCSYLQDPDLLVEEWSRRGASNGAQAELRLQRDEAARILKNQERSLQRLLDAYEAGVLELDELTARSRHVRARVERARLELQEAENRLSKVIEIHEVIGRLEVFRNQVSHRLDELGWEERRQIIRMLVSRVEIDDEGATVVYRVPSVRGGSPLSQGSSRRDAGSDESLHLCGRRDFASFGKHLSARSAGQVGDSGSQASCARESGVGALCR
jgi:site-specific DNA recombinase